MTTRTIVVGAGTVALVGGVVMVLLLVFYGSGSQQDQARLEAVRTAGAIVVGFSGAVALLLAARRQRTGELMLEHQRQVAVAADHDANERRVTELYASAADQLGSAKAPVRLAGLYALERLGELNPTQRETIVNVVCAYLRMPFTHPGGRPAPEADDLVHAQHHERTQELQVRLTAQRILRRHRTPDEPEALWTVPIDLDGANLDHAYLPGMSLADASLYRASLTHADLTGCDFTNADLTATSLTGADLTGANLSTATIDDADLTFTVFTAAAMTGALLTGSTWSSETVWPDEHIQALVTAASNNVGDGSLRIGNLIIPAR